MGSFSEEFTIFQASEDDLAALFRIQDEALFQYSDGSNSSRFETFIQQASTVASIANILKKRCPLVLRGLY